MVTISTEQAKDLRMAFAVWQQDYDPVEDKAQYEMFGLGIVAMDELMALRKERERADPVAVVNSNMRRICKKCSASIVGYSVDGLCEDCYLAAPPAPVVADDSLPYDSQIAEYEQMMEAELKAAASMAHKVKSELSQMAEKLVRDTTELAATLSAETDTTAQQFESLAGKAVSEDASSMADAHMTWLNTNFPRNAYSDEEWEEVSLYTWLAWRDSQRNACFPGT